MKYYSFLRHKREIWPAGNILGVRFYETELRKIAKMGSVNLICVETAIPHTVILIGACCANVNVDSNVKYIWSTAVCGRKNWYNGKNEISRNLCTSNLVSREACVNGQANFAIES